MSKAVLFLSLFFLIDVANATTIRVTNKLDSGSGSLRNAVSIASAGDTIRFDTSLIALGSDSIVLLSEISFSKSLVIKGLFNTTDTLKISGGTSTRIFNITNATQVVFDSVVLVNANASSPGGAILSEKIERLFILNSVFYNNQSINGGGGIYARNYFTSGFHENKMFVTNTLFSSNSTTGASIGNGGAIYTYSSHTYNYVTITHSTMKDNSASANGGAVAVYDISSVWSYLTISNSEISHNNSMLNGAGVFMKSAEGGAIEFSQNKTNIYSNTASGDGGGLYFSAETLVKLSIDYSAISKNIAENGGGIFVYRSSVTSSIAFAVLNLDHTSINRNTASVHGGGVHMQCTSSHSSINATLNMLKSTLAYNIASSNGGAIYTKNRTASTNIYATFNLDNVSILHNEANLGGGIYTSSNSNVGNEYTYIKPEGSIIAFNGTSNISNSQMPTITSNGFNIFDNASINGSIASDTLGAIESDLNLGPLQNNGGFAATMVPMPTSIAINTGNPADSSDAQNIPIVGIRDRGAAEYTCNSSSLQNIFACDSFTSASGQILSASGTYFDTIPNARGCDSIIIYNVMIPLNHYDTTSVVLCAGDSVLFYNKYYHTAGFQADTLKSKDGCDSAIHVLNLTVLASLQLTIDTTVCDTYRSPSGISFNGSGTYYDTLYHSNSCDSVTFMINLSILSSSSSVIDTTVCGFYTSPKGNTYSISGTYIDTLTNQNGCDSMITVNLTVVAMNPSIIDNGNYLSANYTAGDLYEWIDCKTDSLVFTGPKFYFITGGSYQVKITKNDCEEISPCYTFSHVGMENSGEDLLIIYPNPTKNRLTIKGVEVEKLRIIGLLGQEILLISNSNIVDVSGLASGCYFVEINGSIRKLFSKK